MTTTANQIRSFYNNHFFAGEDPRPRLLSLSLKDGYGKAADFPTVELSPSKVFEVGHLPIKLETPITCTVVLVGDGGEAITLPPQMISSGRVTLDELFKAAYNLASQQPEPTPEHEAAAGEATDKATEEPEEPADNNAAEYADDLPEVLFNDFEQIWYGRTEKSQKLYYLEKLKPEVAEKLGQAYRIYKDQIEGEEKQFLSPKGPVYRAVVKKYEKARGLRK